MKHVSNRFNDFFKKRLIQAPLAGYSCAPFRQLAWQWGRPDYCYTEMLSARSIYLNAQQKKRYQYKAPDEGPLCAQLAANTEAELIVAAQRVVEWGADMVDLNCGCPMPKIRKKCYGSQLLADSRHLYQMITALKSVVDVPVLVKIRVDNQSGDQFNQDVAKAIEDGGADAVTVHGRHWTEAYDTPVSYRDIAEIKQTVAIPVIGNGDVHDTASAKRMFSETGCDAVMIARASVGQPWLFNQIDAELKGLVFSLPTRQQIGEMLLQHVRGLMALEEAEYPAMLQSRQLAKYYARSYLTPEEKIPFYSVSEFSAFEDLVKRLFCTV